MKRNHNRGGTPTEQSVAEGTISEGLLRSYAHNVVGNNFSSRIPRGVYTSFVGLRTKRKMILFSAMLLAAIVVIVFFADLNGGLGSGWVMHWKMYLAEIRIFKAFFPPSRSVEYELLLPPIRVGAGDRVCALCTDGVVYVHTGRRGAGAAVARVPRNVTTVVCRDGYPVGGTPLVSAEECVARLQSVGLLDAVDAHVEAVDASCVRVTVPALVGRMEDNRGLCPSFLVEMRPTTSDDPRVSVSFPRMPSWPLPGGRTPPYFGTAAVKDTDVDRDVGPPLSVNLTSDGSTIVLKFGPEARSTVPEPFELQCSAHFLTVYLGRWGRQHNQLQEVLHGISFARVSNRTFVLPSFTPIGSAPYLRYAPSKLYGFNAIRREGRYCVVTSDEARDMFLQLQTMGATLSLQRFNFAGEFTSHTIPGPKEEKSASEWWQLPPLRDGVREYNLDAWLADSESFSPPVVSVADYRAGSVLFRESAKGFLRLIDVFSSIREATKHGRWYNMRVYTARMLALLGGDHRIDKSSAGVGHARMGVISGYMAFYLHPGLEEATRLFGLLRPSEHVSAEADRLYALYAASIGWPTDGGAVMRDTLRPQNFKGVIGIHVRRREGTCRREAVEIGDTNFALKSGAYLLDRKDPTWNGRSSTVTNIERDCSWHLESVVELYQQYAQWLRKNISYAPERQLVPTVYIAYDDQSGPMADNLEKVLQQLSANDTRKSTGEASTSHPRRFVASYDIRLGSPMADIFYHAKKIANKLFVELKSEEDRTRMRQREIVGLLYEVGLREVQTMSFDYIMMTNMHVFRGNIISSVSTNVMLRRWGRGLPNHGTLAGYLEGFYKSIF